MKHSVLTIGHSTHPIGDFVALLRAHGVTAVGDVRSMPYINLEISILTSQYAEI